MFAAFGAPIKEGFQSESGNRNYQHDVSHCVVYDDIQGFSLNGEVLPQDDVIRVGETLHSYRNLCGTSTEQVEEDTDSDEDPEEITANKEEEEARANEKRNIERRNNMMNARTIATTIESVVQNEDEDDEDEDDDEEDNTLSNSSTEMVGENNDNEDENDEENNDGDEENNDDDEENTDNEDDDEVPTTTTGIETFFGGKIENFANGTSNTLLSSNVLLKALMMSCLFYVLAHNDTRKYLVKNIFKSIGDKYYLFGAMVIFFVLYYLINLFL